VDENGIESGPSDYIAMARPFIYTGAVSEARVGQPYSYTVQTIFSIGDLRCRTIEKGKSYNAKFWDGEQPQYTLGQGPAWLSIDADSGTLSGTPPADAAGQHTVKVKAAIEGVGEDLQEFTLTVAQ